MILHEWLLSMLCSLCYVESLFQQLPGDLVQIGTSGYWYVSSCNRGYVITPSDATVRPMTTRRFKLRHIISKIVATRIIHIELPKLCLTATSFPTTTY